MPEKSSRLQPLGSPAFIVALALLVLNDFLLKPLFHDWITGKLSDFAGLFAVAIFCATFWPRRPRLIGVVLGAAFVFWKSSASQPLIDWLDGFAPFPFGRTVDYTDLSALPVIWLGLWAAYRVRPWPLPRVAQVAIALFAPIAFCATSKAFPHYGVSGTLEIVGPSDVAAPDAAAVQDIVDEVAAKHDLRCQVCDPLGEGRVYMDASSTPTLVANFDDQRQTVYFQIVGRNDKRATRKDVDGLSMDLRAALGQRFPDLKLTDYVARQDFRPEPGGSTLTFTVRLDVETPNVAAAESARRTLSQIVEDTVREHDLRIAKDYFIYYAGKRIGFSSYDHELILIASYNSPASLSIIVTRRSDAAEPLQRSLAATIGQRLEAAFGAERVTLTNTPWQ